MEADLEKDIRSISKEDRPGTDLSGFADSYATFNRVVNTLQRQYLELKEEFSAQNDRLALANRKLVEMSARNLAATEFLNRILDSLSVGVVAINQEGEITHFNPSASAMLGIRQGEPLGKLYRDIIPHGEPIEANALWAKDSGQSVEGVEKQITLKDGSRLVVSVSVALLTDEENDPAGAVEIFHDLTKIKRMEQEIARLNTLAALGEMAAAVAHQVRNPLSGILGYGSLLKRELSPDDPRQKLITKITDGVQTLNSTVTTLLNYTQYQELNRENIDFKEFIFSTVQIFNRDHPDLVRRIEFKIDSPERPQEQPGGLQIDPVLMRQVLHNLFANACEAADSNGHITVSFRQLPRQTAVEKYSDRLLLDGGETVFEVTVTDDGPGLPEDAEENLFAPFYTTREGGTGLGLAVAWKIVKGHSGDIFAANIEGTGACFTIVLPVRINQAPGSTTEVESAQENTI